MKIPKVGSCAICLAYGELTKEDVVPVWYRAAMAQASALPGDQPPRTYLGLCAPCNSRSARLFEDTAAPILKGMIQRTRSELSPADQRLVARWRVKTDLLQRLWVVEQEGSPKERKYHRIRQLAQRMIHNGGHIPPNCSVQIARRDPTKPRPRGINLIDAARPDGTYLHTITRVTSFFMITTIDSDPKSFKSFVANWAKEEALLLIWPPREDTLSYPFSAGVSEDVLEDARKKLGHVTALKIGGPYGALYSAGQRVEPEQYAWSVRRRPPVDPAAFE